MKMRTPGAEFAFQDFMVKHERDMVVFVTGYCHADSHTGGSAFRTFLGQKSKYQSVSLENVDTPAAAMVQAAKAACSDIQAKVHRIYLVSAEDLDVPEEEEESGYPAIQSIRQLCDNRDMELHSVTISGGENLLEEIVAGRMELEEDDDEYLELLRGNPMNCLLEKKLKDYEAAESLETLAELLRAVHTVAQANGWSEAELEQARGI